MREVYGKHHQHRVPKAINPENKIAYYLFTRANPLIGTLIDDKMQSLKETNFNSSHPTRMLIHDWKKAYDDPMAILLTEAWLNKSDYNIISVDWPQARNTYAFSRSWVTKVGQQINHMIQFLRKLGLSMQKLHLVGKGLGAHVAGIVGKGMVTNKIQLIIGLDPARANFFPNKPDERLAAHDAHYVEAIHTNCGTWGYTAPLGVADFYVNGGLTQPGCDFPYPNVCAHDRSYIYLAEAITRENYGSISCKEYQDAISKRCGSERIVEMGDPFNAFKARGSYYVPVRVKPPYGLESDRLTDLMIL